MNRFIESLRVRRSWWLLPLLIGIPLGVGTFTFAYADGFSYFSKDPRSCANCHIMNDQYSGWQKSSHHAAATCNDCHMPQAFFAKWFTKAENGYRHSRGFTLQDFHEPIMINERNSRILQANCVRCHEGLTHQTADTNNQAGSLRCVHCHSHVGHGLRK